MKSTGIIRKIDELGRFVIIDIRMKQTRHIKQ